MENGTGLASLDLKYRYDTYNYTVIAVTHLTPFIATKCAILRNTKEKKKLGMPAQCTYRHANKRMVDLP